jgi:hypothetical protein
MSVYSPKNCQAVQIKHSGAKVAKVLGVLAERPPVIGSHVRGLLVKKDFGHMLLARAFPPSLVHFSARPERFRSLKTHIVPTKGGCVQPRSVGV